MVAFLYFSRFALFLLFAIAILFIYKNMILLDGPCVIVKNKYGKTVLNSPMSYNFLGRRSGSDLRFKDMTISRIAFVLEVIDSHCVLHRVGHGKCRKIGSCEQCDDVLEVHDGEKVKIGDETFQFNVLQGNLFPNRKQAFLLLMVTLIQLILGGQLFFQGVIIPRSEILFVYLGFIIIEWGYCSIVWLFRVKEHLTVEILAMLLFSIGLTITGTNEADLMENAAFIALGFIAFLICTLIISWYENTSAFNKHKVSQIAAVLILILIGVLSFMPLTNGARISVPLGDKSVNLLPFCELLFLILLSSYDPLDCRFNHKSMILAVIIFAVFSLVSVLRLNELGSVAVFIVLLLAAVYARTGNVIWLVVAVLLGVILVFFLAQTDTFRFRLSLVGTSLECEPWERTQVAEAVALGLASGGLFGVSAGAGELAAHVAAGETDLVFALLSEELGFLHLLVTLLLIGLMTWIGLKNSFNRHYSVHVGASLCVSVIIVKCLLAALGSFDMAPLTGLGVPLLSQGNVNLIVSWLYVAFLAKPFNFRRDFNDE